MLAEAAGLDMADWREPTAQGYLHHASKVQVVQALKEAGPDLADDGVGAMKKDVLVVKAASRLAGKRWLPAMLRPRSAPERTLTRVEGADVPVHCGWQARRMSSSKCRTGACRLAGIHRRPWRPASAVQARRHPDFFSRGDGLAQHRNDCLPAL